MYFSIMHVTVTPLNTLEYMLDSRDKTLTARRTLIIGGYFMDLLANPAFAILPNQHYEVVKCGLWSIPSKCKCNSQVSVSTIPK